MAKWASEQEPELVPVPLDPIHFQQILAEIAEVLLNSYRQLHKSHPAQSIEPVLLPCGRQRHQAESEGSNEK